MRKLFFGVALYALLAGHGAAAQGSQDPIRIGVLTDMSGQFSHESGEGSVTAVKMAVEDFGGKVLGLPIEVLVADHQNKNEVAVAKAREWYDVQKVDLITNLINSAIALVHRVSPTTAARRTAYIMRTTPTRWPMERAKRWSRKGLRAGIS
jgi:branched-chain amino acid transport system substrate-binding protein